MRSLKTDLWNRPLLDTWPQKCAVIITYLHAVSPRNKVNNIDVNPLQVANAFLTPNNLLDAIPDLANEDYVEAQTMGRLHGNCTQFYDACPISIFQACPAPVALLCDLVIQIEFIQ